MSETKVAETQIECPQCGRTIDMEVWASEPKPDPAQPGKVMMSITPRFTHACPASGVIHMEGASV